MHYFIHLLNYCFFNLNVFNPCQNVQIVSKLDQFVVARHHIQMIGDEEKWRNMSPQQDETKEEKERREGSRSGEGYL